MIIFFISLFASIIGALCGIGGGIIIKPLLDAISPLGAETISFLSGITVLSMSLYSVLSSEKISKQELELDMITPMALGAAIGGIIGRIIFQLVIYIFSTQVIIIIQSSGLFMLTIITLIYSIRKHEIITKEINRPSICILVGLILGILSSFLGIGGGPFNIVVLSYLFSTDTKLSAQNSLYIILFSQITSIFLVITRKTIPTFELNLLILMACAGVVGGIVGKRLNKYLSSRIINKLFIYVNILIIIISIYNLTNVMI